MKTEKNKIDKIINEWKEFDIDKQRNRFEEIAKQIALETETSKLARRELSEQTKLFSKESLVLKQNENYVDLHNKFGKLIRQYQTEINKLTQRCISSETIFFDLFQKLLGLSDPVQPFKLLKEKMDDEKNNQLILENKKLEEKLIEFQKEFGEIQNREVTIRKMKEKMQEMDKQMNELVEERAEKIVSNKIQHYNQLLNDANQANSALHEKIQKMSNELSVVRHSNEVAQSNFLLLSQKYESITSSNQSKTHLLLTEIERLTHINLQLTMQLVKKKLGFFFFLILFNDRRKKRVIKKRKRKRKKLKMISFLKIKMKTRNWRKLKNSKI